MDTLALNLLILIPIAAAVLIVLSPRENPGIARAIAFLAGLSLLLISVFVFAGYDFRAGGFQFEVTLYDWIAPLHVGYHVGVDGISVPMILLSGILSFAAILASFGIKDRVKEYFALLLLVIAGVVGSFVTLDLFFFIIFYELASIPMYFLIGMWGSDGQHASRGWVTKRDFAALKLILYLQLGGALILGCFFAFYFFAKEAGLPHHTFDYVELLRGAKFANVPHFAAIIFPVLFVAFGIEAGLFPFHTWLPDGHSAAPTAVSMLLAGVLLKMGAYGIMRFACGLLPGGKDWLPWFGVIAVINILYGAWCALKQFDLKYIIAYSSVSHMGIVFLGIATQNIMGWSGAVFQMFSHGIITALLFALAGIVYEKTHTRDITKHGGLAPKMPFVAACFAVGGLASLGLPTLSGFVAEFLTFMGSYGYAKVLMVLAVFGLVATALYILLTVKKVFFGPPNPAFDSMRFSDTWWEKLHVGGLIAAAFLFGLLPGLITSMAQGTIQSIVNGFISSGSVAWRPFGF